MGIDLFALLSESARTASPVRALVSGSSEKWGQALSMLGPLISEAADWKGLAGDRTIICAGRDELHDLMKTEACLPAGVCFGLSCHAPKILDRPIFVADVAVAGDPGPYRRAEIGAAAARFAARAGVDMPRVAMLAAVEKVHPAVPRTVEAADAAKALESLASGSAHAQGPLSMDVAVLPEAAREKGATGPVAGRADVLVAPDLACAAGLCSAFNRFAGMPSGMALLGCNTPIAFSSRLDRIETLAISALLAILSLDV